MRIVFPPPPGLELKSDQEIVLNGSHATVRQVGDRLEIDDQGFIEQLLELGFKPGRNDSLERLKEILKHVPEKYRQNFYDGVMGK